MAADQPHPKVEATAQQQAAQAAEANRLRQAALSTQPAHVESHPAAPAAAPHEIPKAAAAPKVEQPHTNRTPSPAIAPGSHRHLPPQRIARPTTPGTVNTRTDQTQPVAKPVQVGQPAPVAPPGQAGRWHRPEQQTTTPQQTGHSYWKPAVAGGIAAGATLELTSSPHYRTMTAPGQPIIANAWNWNREHGWDYTGGNGWLWGQSDWWNTQSQWNQPPGTWINIDGNWVNIGDAYGQPGYGYGPGDDAYSQYQDPNSLYQDPGYYQDPRYYQGPQYQDARYQDPRYQDPRYDQSQDYYHDPNAQYQVPDRLVWTTPTAPGYAGPQRYPYGMTDSQRYRYAQDPRNTQYQDAQYQDYLYQQNPRYWADYGRQQAYQDPRYYGGGLPFGIGGSNIIGGAFGNIIGSVLSGLLGQHRHHHGGFPFGLMNNFAYNSVPYAYQNQYDYQYAPAVQPVPYYYPPRHHHRWI